MTNDNQNMLVDLKKLAQIESSLKKEVAQGQQQVLELQDCNFRQQQELHQCQNSLQDAQTRYQQQVDQLQS